jgi:hypothetical protein
MQGLKSSDGVLRNDVFLILAVTNIVGSVWEEVNESIWDETDEIHRLFLGSHIRRQCLFYNLIKRG